MNFVGIFRVLFPYMEFRAANFFPICGVVVVVVVFVFSKNGRSGDEEKEVKRSEFQLYFVYRVICIRI